MSDKKPTPRILSLSEYFPDDIKINVSKRVVDFYFPTHSHEFYEIEFIIDGCAKYTVNGKEFALEKGSLYFVTPADIHGVEVSESPACLINVQFDEKSVEPTLMLHLLKLGRECCKLNGDDFSYASKLFELILSEYMSNGRHKNICLKNYLENILVLFLRCNAIEDQIASNDNGNMSKAVIYIHSKFREGITLTEAAEFSGFTPSYFSVKFREHTGSTFKDYVDKLRLSYAENLLNSTRLSITEVCFSSGFKNVSNFIRRFSEKYGVSPAKYRQNRS